MLKLLFGTVVIVGAAVLWLLPESGYLVRVGIGSSEPVPDWANSPLDLKKSDYCYDRDGQPIRCIKI